MTVVNTAVPFGLIPIKDSTGGYMRLSQYFVPASLNALAVGTPMAQALGANTQTKINGANYPIGSLPTLVIATGGAGDALIGSIVSMDPVPSSPLTGNINPANTLRTVWVADHPDQRFMITDNGTNALVSANIGDNANLVIGSVNSIGVDGSTLDSSAPATTQNFQLKILNLLPVPNNTIGLVNAIYEVMINQHQLAPNTAGA